MDIIIKRRVAIFADKMGISKENYRAGDLFELYVAYVYLKKYVKNNLEIMEMIRTGDDDGGIDIAAVIINGVIVTDVSEVEENLNETENRLNLILIQAKSATKFDAKYAAKFLHGVYQIANSLNESELEYLDDGLFPVVEILRKCFDHIDRFDISSIPVELYYVTTAPHSGIDVSKDKQVNSALDGIQKLSVFQENLHVNFHGKDDITAKIADNSGPQKITFKFDKKVSIPEGPEGEGVEQAFIGVISVDQLLTILTEEDSRDKIRMRDGIFDDNVRLFQGGDNTVNKKIMDTLKSNQRTSFPFLNNGITIVAREMTGIGENFILSGYQVVNGCQTGNQIVNWIKDEYAYNSDFDPSQLAKVWVPIKLIQAKDSATLEEITLSTNTQTPISPTDMQGVREHAKEVEEYFGGSGANGLRYARQGLYSDSSNSFPRLRTVTTEELNRAFASCIYGESSVAIGRSKELQKPGSYVWQKHPPELYYFSCMVVFRIDRYIAANEIKGLRPAKYHIAMLTSALLFDELRSFYESQDSKILKKISKKIEAADDLQASIEKFVPITIDVTKRYFSNELSERKTLIKDTVRSQRHQQALLKLLDEYIAEGKIR